MNSNLMDDFSNITEHYYDELGKLDECKSFFAGKEYKRLRRRIVSLLFYNINTLFLKENVANKVEQHQVGKEYKIYKEENNLGFKKKLKSLFGKRRNLAEIEFDGVTEKLSFYQQKEEDNLLQETENNEHEQKGDA